jgi:DNA-directed RNA polymerase specialized sigma24 family protein
MTQKSDKLYFGEEVDAAIAEYLKEPSSKKKSKIFEKTIYSAFLKLAEYHYHKMPVLKNEEVISECVVFLYEQLHKFNPEKSARGFPYFNIIAKHFFIQKIKTEKKQQIQEQEFTVSLNDSSPVVDQLAAPDEEEKLEQEQFIAILKKTLPVWREKLPKKQEKQMVDAIISLLENAENIDIYKKKALFFYIREITGMNSKQVAMNLNKIKKKFDHLLAKYNRGDI